MPGSNQSIDLHIEDDVPMLNSAVVAAAIKNPIMPQVPSDEKRTTQESCCSARRKEPKPHQARMSDKDTTEPAGIYIDFFIEIFAGTAGLSTHVKALGQIVYTFDTNTGRDGDILNKDTIKTHTNSYEI